MEKGGRNTSNKFTRLQAEWREIKIPKKKDQDMAHRTVSFHRWGSMKEESTRVCLSVIYDCVLRNPQVGVYEVNLPFSKCFV